ncbi:hypothetical protein [Aromatoleum evansii]|uniref:hypothetical protein n=1 Tax=Aromatoleum evansii TaxID=59406 RepID=UPI00145DE0BC|nr:hypothetical protein [Aromatoleum evansii]NMG29537.1 hypothetical protein [Aromatoleum evansii]
MPDAIPQHNLPIPARCALEYLEAQGLGNRTIAKLDSYLDHYSKAYGQTVEPMVRFSCHRIALRRYELSEADATGLMEHP